MKPSSFSKIFVIFLLFIFQQSFSQDYSKMSVKELTTLMDKEVAAEEYAKAGNLKTAIEIKTKLDKAVQAQDYKRAAELKGQLQQLSNGATISSGSNEGGGSTGSTDLEYYNTIYIYDGKEYRPLERQAAEFRTSTYSAVWVAGASSFWEVDRMYSTVQINNQGDYSFYVKLQQGVDPVMTFELNRLDIVGKERKRSLLQSKTTAVAYAGGSTNQIDDANVSISFEKVSDEVYRIFVDDVIPPGEYAFAQESQWCLFGSRNQYTDSDQQIKTRQLNGAPIYNEDGKYGRTAWLGYDYTLLKVRTNGMKVDHERMKEVFQLAVEKINDNRMESSRDIGKLLSRDRGIMWNPVYMYEFNEKYAPQSYVISADQSYELTDELIEENLQKYEVNYPMTGLIIIPEVFDVQEREMYGRAVWFDFDTRKIVHSMALTKRLLSDESFEEGEVWADFYDFLKVLAEDKGYRREIKEYN